MLKFIRPTSFNKVPNSIRIDQGLCEIIHVEIFAFLDTCDFESWSMSLKLVSNVAFNKVYDDTKFESNWSIDVQVHAHVTV